MPTIKITAYFGESIPLHAIGVITEFPSSRANILIFDSAGIKHPETVVNITRFLQARWDHESVISSGHARLQAFGTHLKVPRQTNEYDCGVFLLHFVKAFLDNPREHADKAQFGLSQTIDPTSIRNRLKECILGTIRDRQLEDTNYVKR
ncbi:hypothetical protein OF83DRAFT_1174810 [Amylostereum chailletii]|nr:hypothetical protein OF83DRAFT_1174810 [Amylostereum chailletii]